MLQQNPFFLTAPASLFAEGLGLRGLSHDALNYQRPAPLRGRVETFRFVQGCRGNASTHTANLLDENAGVEPGPSQNPKRSGKRMLVWAAGLSSSWRSQGKVTRTDSTVRKLWLLVDKFVTRRHDKKSSCTFGVNFELFATLLDAFVRGQEPYMLEQEPLNTFA